MEKTITSSPNLIAVLLMTGLITYYHTSNWPIKPVINELYMTAVDADGNLDSVAIWHGNTEQNWLLVTAKTSDFVIVYDGATGIELKRFGGMGTGAGELNRPNGIAIVDNLAFITERDNKRVQVFALPDCTPLGTFGEDSLIRPYGIAVARQSDQYLIYVTDNYHKANGEVPRIEDLGSRVHRFDLAIGPESSLQFRHRNTFGETQGQGVLFNVESILIDLELNRLLIADECEEQRNIKIYSLDGNFSGRLIPADYFRHEPEGIALSAQNAKASGYYITTDQSKWQNTFHIFDRKSMEHLASFRGKRTRNTDGIALTRHGFGRFKQGAFFAVHDDKAVAAFCLADIERALRRGKKRVSPLFPSLTTIRSAAPQKPNRSPLS